MSKTPIQIDVKIYVCIPTLLLPAMEGIAGEEGRGTCQVQSAHRNYRSSLKSEDLLRSKHFHRINDASSSSMWMEYLFILAVVDISLKWRCECQHGHEQFLNTLPCFDISLAEYIKVQCSEQPTGSGRNSPNRTTRTKQREVLSSLYHKTNQCQVASAV